MEWKGADKNRKRIFLLNLPLPPVHQPVVDAEESFVPYSKFNIGWNYNLIITYDYI